MGVNVIKQLKAKVAPKVNNVIQMAFCSKYLFCTNIILSTTLSAFGDVLEQNYEMWTGDLDMWDKTRTCHMSLSGVTVGIVCHHWYGFLDRRLPGRTIQLVIKKIVVDQFIGSPVCISTFFGTLAVLEGTSYKDFVRELKKKAWRLYAAEWVVWPPAQFINFYFLPSRYRVLYDNTISLGYDVYTSYVKHN